MTPLLLSKRQAAKLLGIGRDTLAQLIGAGHIRTVDLFGQVKLSREEVERFAREGTTSVLSTAPKARAPRNRQALADITRALVIT